MNKNRFLTVLFAFVPGCGLMYLGYMKKGLQHMLLFALSGYLTGLSYIIHMEWLMALFIICMPILWFYQLFDSIHTHTQMKRNNIDHPADDGFVYPDMLFELKPKNNRLYAKILAVALIAGGCIGIVSGLLNNLGNFFGSQMSWQIRNFIQSYTIPLLVSVILIGAGIKLLIGKKPSDTNKSTEQDLDNERG